jgi:hypothetical protein
MNTIPQDKTEKPGETIQKEEVPKKRNLGLSVLLIFSLVYNGLFLILTISGLFFPGNVHAIMQEYYKQVYISPTLSYILNLSAGLVFGFSFYGLILLWQFKKKGFWFFAITQIIILLILLFYVQSFDWINMAISLLIILILGLASRKMN